MHLYLLLATKLTRVVTTMTLVFLLTAAGFSQSVTSLSVSPASLVGGASATGAVSISRKAPAGGFVVTLSSSAECATVPATVTVMPGSTKATFSIVTSGVASNQSAKLMALGGGTYKTYNLTVYSSTLVSVAIAPKSVVGGDVCVGVVSLNGFAPNSGASVSLTSSSKYGFVPDHVIVPGGANSAEFLVNTSGVPSNVSAAVTGKLGTTTKKAPFTITPATLADLTLSPASVVGGTATVGTVSLNGFAPVGGIVVSLSDSSTSLITLPPSVSIPAGASSADFNVTTGSVGAETGVLILASANGVGISKSLSILSPHLQSLTVNPTSVVGGSYSTGTVTLASPAPAGGCLVSLVSNSDAASVPFAVMVSEGAASATFTITTSVVQSNTSSTITGTLEGKSQTALLSVTISHYLANSAWPKFHGNAQNTGLGFGAGAIGSLKWSYATGAEIGASSPSIGADGTVYIGSWDGNLYAIDPTGGVKWTYQTGDRVYSSPTVGSDGTIYVSSTNGTFFAINSDGSPKWSFQTSGFSNSAPAIASDGTIYIPSMDGNLYALNPNGTQKWVFNLGNVSGASPAIGPDGTIYIVSDATVLWAIKPDGTLKWGNFTGVGLASPSVGSDGTIYVGSDDNNLYAFDAGGSFKWKYTTGGWVNNCPAIGKDGTIYAGSRDNSLYAIKPNGTLKWKYATGDILLDGSASIGSDGTIYIGSADNFLYAITSTGVLKWRFLTGGWIDSSPAIGADGTIYVGSNDNRIYAIR